MHRTTLRRRRPATLLGGLALAVGLAACSSSPTTGAPTPAPDVAVQLDSYTLSRTLYQSLADATLQRIQDVTGQHLDAATTDGAARIAQVQTNILQQMVHDLVVQQMADARHVTVSDQDLQAAIDKIVTGAGGKPAFDAELAKGHLDETTFRALYRYTVAEQKLRALDTAGYDKSVATALAAAHPQAYVGPCATQHAWPACGAKASANAGGAGATGAATP